MSQFLSENPNGANTRLSTKKGAPSVAIINIDQMWINLPAQKKSRILSDFKRLRKQKNAN